MAAEDDTRDVTLRAEGLEWVERLLSGESRGSDVEALRRWRAQSPRHALALRWAMDLLRVTEELAAPEAEPVAAALPEPANDRWMPSRRVLLGGAVAAGVAAVALVRPPADMWPSLAELLADQRTGPGERRSLALARGLSVELNTRTSISTRQGDDGFAIELITGEAVVENRRAGTVSVQAGDGRVLIPRDAGVAVRRNAGSVCVTCLAGAVSAEQGGERVQVAARQQLVFSPDGIDRPRPVDLAVEMAWRNGFLTFRNAPLAQVVGELNRYRPGLIVLADDELSQRKVFATFRTSRIDDAIAQIRQLTGARATRLPGGLIVLT